MSGAVLASFAAVWLRCLGCAAVLPFGAGQPALLRRFAAAAAAALLFAEGVPLCRELGLLAAAGEFALGLLLGLPAALAVDAAAQAGELLDVQRGQNLGVLYDPYSSAGQPPLAVLLRSYVWVRLLWLGLFEYSFFLLFESFRVVRCGGTEGLFTGSSGLSTAGALLDLVLSRLAEFFETLLPAVLLLLCLDCALALTGRLLPHSQIQTEQLVLKTLFALLLLYWLTFFDLAALLASQGRVPANLIGGANG